MFRDGFAVISMKTDKLCRKCLNIVMVTAANARKIYCGDRFIFSSSLVNLIRENISESRTRTTEEKGDARR